MIFAVSSTGGGGGGTVTTVSAGNLSPLFTTVVSTPTTSPSIAFTLVSQAANLVYASPDGGAGVPSFRSLVAADLPTPAIPITLNYIPKGTGTSIADGTWAFSTNDIYPLTTGSNIGDATHRIGTIFMASTFDYASDLNWITSASTKMTLTTGGDVGIGTSTPSYKLHVVPSSSGDAVYIERAGKHLFVNPNGISTGCDIETDNFMNFTSSGSFRFNGASQINLYGIAGTTNLYLTSDSTTNKGLYLYNINGDGTVVNAGLNISNPSASLHVKSTGNTSATYATKINDSSGNELLYVRNDGHIGIGADPATISTAYLYFKSTSALDFGYYNTITNLNAGGVGYYANVTGGAGVFGIQIDLAQTSGTGQAIRGIAGGSAGDLNIGVYGTGANSTSVSIGVKGNVPNGTSPENYAGYFNTQSEAGLSYGVYGAGIGVSTGTNYGGYFSASNGANNYAIIVPSGGGSVGIGTATPDASAITDFVTTTQGVKFPNMTTAQRTAISSPASGLVVYDTTVAKLYVYTTAWEAITSI